MRKPYTINYLSEFDQYGTHYNQCINITYDMYRDLMDKLIAEKVFPKYSYNKLNMNSPIVKDDKKVFFNLTQRDFFSLYLHLDLKDRNTYFYIID